MILNIKAGLLSLPCADFTEITATYGLDAWKKIITRWQPIVIGVAAIGKCGQQADEELRAAERELRDALREGVEALLE